MAFQDFKKLTDSKFKFGMFMFTKLPSAFFCGVRLRSVTEDKAIVSVPYKWLSQNPFKSTYFACQAMAAEMSTGMLGMGFTYRSKPAVSMLVTKIEGQFLKKGTERIYFECADGSAFKKAVADTIANGEAQQVIAKSIGKTIGGETVSEFTITWGFKAKKK